MILPFESDNSWVINQQLCEWYSNGPEESLRTGPDIFSGIVRVNPYAVVSVFSGKYLVTVGAYSTEGIDLIVDPAAVRWSNFQGLLKRWKSERGAISSVTQMSMCPAYQEIVGMGEAAIPLILSQLRAEDDDPDQWFWALRAITGVDPVHDDDRGNFPKMSQSWLEWGEREGYAG